MDKLKEFNALEDMLTKAGIEYDREDKEPVMRIWDFHQLRSKDTRGAKYVWDVICHKGSYGYEQGLLEMWGKNMIDPEGYLTAKECFEKIKEIVEMKWRANSPATHPPCQVPCIIRTRDGQEHEAMLIHLNDRYHGKIPKDKLYTWRLGKHKFIEDDEVVEWRYAIDI